MSLRSPAVTTSVPGRSRSISPSTPRPAIRKCCTRVRASAPSWSMPRSSASHTSRRRKAPRLGSYGTSPSTGISLPRPCSVAASGAVAPGWTRSDQHASQLRRIVVLGELAQRQVDGGGKLGLAVPVTAQHRHQRGGEGARHGGIEWEAICNPASGISPSTTTASHPTPAVSTAATRSSSRASSSPARTRFSASSKGTGSGTSRRSSRRAKWADRSSVPRWAGCVIGLM